MRIDLTTFSVCCWARKCIASLSRRERERERSQGRELTDMVHTGRGDSGHDEKMGLFLPFFGKPPPTAVLCVMIQIFPENEIQILSQKFMPKVASPSPGEWAEGEVRQSGEFVESCGGRQAEVGSILPGWVWWKQLPNSLSSAWPHPPPPGFLAGSDPDVQVLHFPPMLYFAVPAHQAKATKFAPETSKCSSPPLSLTTLPHDHRPAPHVKGDTEGSGGALNLQVLLRPVDAATLSRCVCVWRPPRHLGICVTARI